MFKRKRAETDEADAVTDGGVPLAASTVAARPKTDALERYAHFLSLEHGDWRAALAPEARKPYFEQLVAFVGAQRSRGPVYPPPEKVFTALNACPLAAVKVVIIGQDPYHGPRQAHGLCFSIEDTRSCTFPPSLRNIFCELHADPAVEFARGPACTPGSNGSLRAWAGQGVLLLNTVLTVSEGAANSHQKKGWEQFTDAVVSAILKRPGKGCVFLLWGLPASKKVPSIDKAKHRVIMSSHPSPLSNTKGDQPFTGSRCFSRCNVLLAELEHEPVDWNI
jgi:uracil-DNA glycosylase